MAFIVSIKTFSAVNGDLVYAKVGTVHIKPLLIPSLPIVAPCKLVQLLKLM
jgi:hypothetical protein